jgi:hypothetical protein
VKFNLEAWKAAFKKAASDLPGHGASDGIVCAVASIRLIRDGLLADMTKDGKLLPGAEHVKDGANGLIAQLTGEKTKLAGFASNASSAAGVCDLKETPASKLAALTD